MHALIVKEFIQLLRDKISLAIVLTMPIAQLLIFGFAINTDIKHLPTIVFDQSKTQASREFISSMVASNYFNIHKYANSMKEVNRSVAAGDTRVGIIFPPDYADRINGDKRSDVQVIIDATENMSASSALSSAQSIGIIKGQEIIGRKFARLGAMPPLNPIDLRIRLWYNPDFVTSWSMVPGVMGLLLVITLVPMLATAIVRENEQGTLEQLLVTPMRVNELLISKIIPYIVVGYLQVIVSIIVGVFVFDMPFLGSVPLFFALTFFYVVANLSLGIMFSCFSANQTQAIQMSTFIILPCTLLSGFIFPIESIPSFFRMIGKCFPITYYISITRQIILKGGGLEYVWQDTLCLAVFILIMFTAAVMMFKRRFVP